MNEQILSNCDADETKSIGDNSLFELTQVDFSTDTYLTGIKSELSVENTNLSNSIGVERSHEYTAELARLDQLFDGRVICLKTFIDANTHSSNETVAKNAAKVWKKLAAYDLFFYKLGYEKELSRAFSMIEEFENPDVKPLIESLVGVAEPLSEVKTAAANLQTLYRKNQGVLATKKEVVPSFIQKKVVIDIINEKLLPYLMVMSRVKPDEYGETFVKIARYIETMNTKIRTRKSRATAPEEEVNSEVE